MGESVTIEVGARKAPLPLDLFLLRVLFLFAAPAGLSSSCPRSPRRRRAVLWRLPEETGVGKRRRVSGKGDGFFSYFYRLWPLPLPLSLSFEPRPSPSLSFFAPCSLVRRNKSQLTQGHRDRSQQT